METSKNSMQLVIEGLLTSSPADFHANHSQRLDDEKAQGMTDFSGRKCVESLWRFNRIGLLGRTFSGYLIGEGVWRSKECRLTWKLRGTKFGRIFCLLRVSVRRTSGIGFGLLPTPDASLGTGGKVQKMTVSITGKA